MLSKPDPNFADLFEIPFVLLDQDLSVIDMNAPFRSLFGDVKGQPVASLSDEFNERKFARSLSRGQSYGFRMRPADEARAQYTVTLKPHGDQVIGLVTDASEIAKNEAMLASYSALIEKQNREIKAKTEQINIWRTRIQNELDQAATVQELLVPPQIRTARIDSRCAPIQELSGDFHDLVMHADGQVTFISGDVAGKGIYAAIMLAQTLTAFRAHYDAPDLTMLACNIVTMMENRFPDGLFVALTLVRQSADGETVQILNLGNPDSLLVDQSGAVESVASVGPAIGFLPVEIYRPLAATQHDLTGRQLFVFSDGLLDIATEDDTLDVTEGREVLAYLQAIGDVSDETILDALMAKVASIKRGDDVTVARFSSQS